ncbi:MAG TPA: glutamine amidotransferase, partial [Pirellulales bacterium]|nr:glutamine amidotransferase [Pirellulales bacterium]
MPTGVTRLSISPVISWWLVAAVAVVLLGLLYFGPARSRTSPTRRGVLAGLRLLVILLLIFAMLRPTLVWTHVTKQAATLLVLVDQSRSMRVTDAVGKKSRWEAAKAALEDARPALADLAEDVEIKIFAFDSEAHAVEYDADKLELPVEADGVQTALGSSLDQVLKSQAGKRLAGVIVLSDGAQRASAPHDLPPQLPARRMADLGYRLYAVAFGQGRGPGQTRDIALDELQVASSVFVKNVLPVTSVARFEGMQNQTVPDQLLAETLPGKMELIGVKQIAAKQDGERVSVTQEWTPEVPGEVKISVLVPPQPGELITTNNEISTFVTVLKGGLNVLYLEGNPAGEQKFLRRSIQSPDINLAPFVMRADRADQTRPPELAEQFQPGKYDVYMIGDLDSVVFHDSELKQLAETVERGAGLIMLGGLQSFGPGGYGNTPLADVLPIRFDRLERQNLGEKIREDLHLPGPLQMRPTPEAAGQYLTLLAPPAQNAAAWAQLPPLAGANKFAGLKPTALVLAESQQRQPLLVAGEYGAGRVLAFAGDTTWRWWMHGHEAEHRRFWRQVILWLARKDESTEGRVWIKLEQRRYGPGARVEFTAGAQDPQGQPLADARLEAEVLLPDGKRSAVRMRRDPAAPGEMSGTFLETQPVGDYTLVVTATH